MLHPGSTPALPTRAWRTASRGHHPSGRSTCACRQSQRGTHLERFKTTSTQTVNSPTMLPGPCKALVSPIGEVGAMEPTISDRSTRVFVPSTRPGHLLPLAGACNRPLAKTGDGQRRQMLGGSPTCLAGAARCRKLRVRAKNSAAHHQPTPPGRPSPEGAQSFQPDCG